MPSATTDTGLIAWKIKTFLKVETSRLPINDTDAEKSSSTVAFSNIWRSFVP